MAHIANAFAAAVLALVFAWYLGIPVVQQQHEEFILEQAAVCANEYNLTAQIYLPRLDETISIVCDQNRDLKQQ